MRRLRRFTGRFVIALALLGALRVLAPIGLRAWVERTLDAGANECSIDDVDLNLWRGAYEIEGLWLAPRAPDDGGGTWLSQLELRRADLSIEWPALFLRGQLVAEVVLHQPRATWRSTPSPDDPEPESGDEPARDVPRDAPAEGVVEALDGLSPFRIDRFVVREGTLRFLDLTVEPAVDLYVGDFYGEMLDLTNVRDADGEPQWAEVEIAGRPFGTGELEGRMRFDPLAQRATFDLDMAVRHVRATDLNDLLVAHAGVDAEAGRFGLFAELAVADGRVEGYVKPVFEDLRLARFGDIEDPADALAALWEQLVAVAAEVLENQPHDRLATRIPIRGELGPDGAQPVESVLNLLRNAFVAALRPTVDESISLEDARAERGAVEN